MVDEEGDVDQRYRLLVEGIRDFAIYMLDPEGRVASWNLGAERLKGYRGEEVMGQPFSLFFTPEDRAAGHPEAELRAAAGEGRYEAEGWRVRRDGSRFWASVAVTALRDAGGKLRGFAKITRDMTERRRADEQVRQREEQLAVTLDSIGDAVIATDEQGAVTRLNPVAERLTGWTRKEALGQPLLRVFNIINEETRRPAPNPVERVLREGMVVGLANHTALIARDGSERAIADSAAPIRGIDGAVRGAVMVFRDVTSERAMERALRESEERFRLLVANVRDYAIFMLDLEGRVASWNAGAARIKGYTADQIVGQHFSIFYSEEDRRAGKPAHELEVAAREGRFEDEGWRKRKDGSLFWANVIITAVRDEQGQLRGFAKVTRDFTERRRAEEELRQREEQLAVTLDSIGDGVIATDAGGAVARLNPVAEQLTGWSRAEAAGRPLLEVFNIVNEETRRRAVNPVDRVLREGVVVGLANHTALIARDGSERAIADSAAPIRGVDGAVRGAVMVFRDVTSERAMERALRESEERFRLLVDNVRDYAIFMLDPEGRVASWNPGAARIKGYTADQIVGQHFSVFYSEEDRRAGKPAHELEVAAREGRFEDEGWRKRKDGSRFWANVIITAVRDEEQRLRGFAKVTRDFTERRQAEETARRLEAETAARRAAEEGEAQLRASEERLRQQGEQLAIILAGIAEGVTAQDAGGLLFANEAAARICGFPSAEAMREAGPERILDHVESFDEAGQRFDWRRLPGRRALAGEPNAEALLRTRDRRGGGDRWSHIRATAMTDAAGRPQLSVNIWNDVTTQRRREQAARFISDATGILSSGLDLQQAVEGLVHLVVPALADWATVQLLEGGKLATIAVAHVDPSRVATARAVQQRYPAPADAPGSAAVARSGRSELWEEITDEIMTGWARSEEHLGMLRALGLRSAMVVPIAALGQPIGVLTLASGESGRRFGREELALTEELGRRAGFALENARLYRSAVEAVKLRDDFLSVAGHELKTPLTAVILKVAALLRAFQSEQPPEPRVAAEKLGRIAGATARLERLVSELLDVSRITSGKLQLEPQRHDLVAIAREVIGRFAEQSARAGSPILLEAAQPVEGSWDRPRLDQVLTNLLSNALKYGPGQPVRVEVSAEKEHRARLRVEDRGIGVPVEDQARIFDRFERAVPDRNYGGLGLGLWIARRIVEAHGGEIRVQSAPGQGATFEVLLPR